MTDEDRESASFNKPRNMSGNKGVPPQFFVVTVQILFIKNKISKALIWNQGLTKQPLLIPHIHNYTVSDKFIRSKLIYKK